MVGGGAARVGAALQATTLLEPLEVWFAVLILYHDFAVQQNVIVGQSVHGARNLGKSLRGIIAVARDQFWLAVRFSCEQAITIVLQLEDPVLACKRFVG